MHRLMIRCCAQLTRRVALAFITLGVAMSSVAAQDLALPDLGSPASEVLSASDEARIGQRMMREIRQELDLVDDPAVSAYIRDLGQRIATATREPAAGYQFFVIDDARINAFAMPGGYIGIHTGLIAASRTESELGAVIAHELSHVTQRHIARRIAAARGSNLRTAAMVLAGLLISTQSPQAGMAAATSGMASGIDSQLAYSRDHEREADRAGMRILTDAGLNPKGMPDFFQVLLNDSRYRSNPPVFLSTHPLTEARIADARSIANQLETKNGFESPGYDYVRARVSVASADNAAAALRTFRARHDQTPNRATTYGLALAQIATGQFSQAETTLQTLINTQGEHALLSLALAEVALANNAIDTALKRIERGLSVFPSDSALRYLRVEALLRDDRAARALTLTRGLSHENPRAPEVWALHGRAANAAGDRAEAALAAAQFYAVQGDLEAGLSQLRRIDNTNASSSQRARANALRDRWQDRLQLSS